MPLIPRIKAGTCIKLEASGAFAVDWSLEDGSILRLLAILTERAVPIVVRVAGRLIFATHPNIRGATERKRLAPWSVTWLLERGVAEHRTTCSIRAGRHNPARLLPHLVFFFLF